MTRQRLHKPTKKWVSLEEWYRLQAQDQGETNRSDLPTPLIIGDIEPYISPLSEPHLGPKDGRKWITSRSERREELKRHGMREVDPSERKDFIDRPAQAKAKADAAIMKGD